MARLLQFAPGGIAEYWGPEGVRTRYASTCSHCQHISEADTVRELDEITDRCRGCMKRICLPCARKPCYPWEKRCEDQEREFLQRKLEQASWRCY